MSLYADRVQETSTTTGTGTLTLAGAVSAYRTFAAAFSDGTTVRYAIVGGTDWEVGEGVYSAGTLTRVTVFSSSNAGALVSFAAGAKTVWCDVPAAAFEGVPRVIASGRTFRILANSQVVHSRRIVVEAGAQLLVEGDGALTGVF